MRPLLDNILTVNLVCSTAIFYAGARIYILPKIGKVKREAILIPILILHSLRHLGLMFLADGATYPGMPPQFAYPAAVGDFITAVLAFAAIPVTARNLPGGRALLWAFNIVGTIDLATAITLATIHDASPYMSAAYWIPAFWVPGLLVTHYIVFVVLLSRPRAGSWDERHGT
ncbi:MAG: hypothetical protein ACM31I_04135 [Deltaproteobacteria bacterium]